MATMQRFNRVWNRELKIVLLLAVVLVALVAYALLRQSTPLLTHAQANKLYQDDAIAYVTVKKPYLYITTKDNKRYKIYEKAVNTAAFYSRYPVSVKTDDGVSWYDLLTLALIVSAFGYFIYYLKTLPGTRMPAKRLEEANEGVQPIRAMQSDVRFEDVAGIDEVKEELDEIIDFMREPQKYAAMDIRLPKGVLLVGPPGVGKTHVAKAVAGEANVPFFYQSGASFVHIYVGMGAKRVHELFEAAKRNAPAIIFIDEIDAVGKSRGEARNDEREATLNQLLVEMDGFENTNGVIVMAATNKIDVLDEALLRPGRFDRRVFISLPDFADRKRILSLYLANKPHDVDIETVARMTVGFSAAALETLINEAALYALRHNQTRIAIDDIEAVKDKVLLGKRKVLAFSEQERKIQAYYQAAKALCATWFDVSFDKIGIVSTQMAMDESEIVSRTEMFNRIKIYLAGSVACEMRFNERFSNAKEDIAQAKALVRQAIFEYAMGEDYVASVEMESTLLRRSADEVRTLLKSLETALERASTQLLETESIDQEQCREILRALF